MPENRALLEGFLAAQSVRGTPQTLARYARACQALLEFVGARPLAALDRHELQRALAALHARGLGPRTLAVTLSAWRRFYRYLAREDARFDVSRLAGLRIPKAAKRLPNALTEAQAVHLVAPAAQSPESPEALRDQAAFELLYGTGMRVGELLALNLSDIDLAAAEVRVFGKGRKERVLPLGPPAVTALERWLAVRPASSETALFLGARGGRLSASVLRRALRRRALERGFAERIYPHRLRHSFASHVLQSSGDLRAVQELMGHASIASTQVYTHLDFAHLARVYDQAHPRAKKRG
ncbi:MAG: tyrosine recombinase XerC [Casimicrobiaceae bacterium]|nr:tyrosine recombinase XerC [Casimicrobiaceae bacterium]MDW8311744.1 tyrosine recombinase XerC [Burkholderiales bacterium]